METLTKSLFLCLALALTNAAPTQHEEAAAEAPTVYPKSHCEHHRDSLKCEVEEGVRRRIGTFIPQCDSDGRYRPQQCHSSTGYCWCVNSRGEERVGTSSPPGTPTVDCGKLDEHGDAHADLPNRCDGIEFDAITPDEKGNTFFFKGAHLWKGFRGPAQLSNESFKELDDLHHIGHVDAAFRMHHEENPDDHDHIYFFLDDKVFSYYDHKLEDGYPKDIQDDFPGIPSHLDAAVECPKGECMADSVLFFKGHDIHVYDITTKTVKTKAWPLLPVCTAAFRWLEHYYCFHGHNFTRFNPISGEVNGTYPKDARRYFMDCYNFGHGGNYTVPKCSEIKLDAIATNDAGKTYLFSGPIYMRLDTIRDGLHAFPITRAWKEVTSGVDAVFSYTDKIYIIKDDQVYIYKSAAHYALVEGYPKSLKEELGIEGHVDAAFVCPDAHAVHVIQGSRILEVDLTATPRVTTKNIPLPLSNIDAAHCDANGINVFKGSVYYHYKSPKILAMSRIAAVPQKITSAMMGCQD